MAMAIFPDDTRINHDHGEPNHIIFWLDPHIGHPEAYEHLKKAFGSTTDPCSGTWTMLNDKDYDSMIVEEAAIPVTSEGVRYLLRMFADENTCLEAFERSQDKRIFFIISGSMGREIVPKIIERYRYIFTDPITNNPYPSVYVFRQNIELHMEWAIDYVEYIQMFDFDTDLLKRLTRDIAEYYIERGRRIREDNALKDALQRLYWAKTLWYRYDKMWQGVQTCETRPVRESDGMKTINELIAKIEEELNEELTDGDGINSDDETCLNFVGIPNTPDEQTNSPSHLPSPKHQDQPEVIIICFDITYEKSFSVEHPENFMDTFKFITRVRSIKDKVQFLLIGTTTAELVVELIHTHFSVEKIYLYSSNDDQGSHDWIRSFSKVAGVWIDSNTLDLQVLNDIRSLKQRQPVSDRSTNPFAMIDSQKVDINSTPNLQVTTTMTNDACLVIMHCENPMFHEIGNLNGFKEFTDVDTCAQFINEQTLSNVFLIISGNMEPVDLESMFKLKQIHAIYSFCANEVVLPMNTRRMRGNFNNLEDLATKFHNDVDFYRLQQPHSPEIYITSTLDATKKLMTQLDANRVEFLVLQMFIDILPQIPLLTFELEEILNPWKTLFIQIYDENESLILKMNGPEMNVYDDGPIILKIFSQIVRHKKLHHLLSLTRPLRRIYDCALQPSVIHVPLTVYRADIVSEKDIMMLESNYNALITMTTFFLATRSLLSARTIARQLADSGLLTVLFEVELFGNSPVIDVDEDRVMFRIGTIFQLKSINRGPDKIWYVTMNCAQSNLQTMMVQLHCEIGIPLTWLTFGRYLYKLDRLSDAEHFYSILEAKLTKYHPDLPLMYSNMGTMYEMAGKLTQAEKYYGLAETYARSINSSVRHSTVFRRSQSMPALSLPIQTCVAVWIHDEKLSTNHQKSMSSILEKTFHHFRIFDEIDDFFIYINEDQLGAKIILIISYIKHYSCLFKLSELRKELFQDVYVFLPNFARVDVSSFTNVDDLFEVIHRDLLSFQCKSGSSHCNADNHDKKCNLSDTGCLQENLSKRKIYIRHHSHESPASLVYPATLRILGSMKHDKESVEEMLTRSREAYKDNCKQLDNIDELKEYDPVKAIEYYTRDTFLFRIFNDALRTEDIEEIFPYRVYFTDLSQMLEDKKMNGSFLIAYRGKPLTPSELQHLIDDKDGLITINGFLSTSIEENVAQMYAGNEQTNKSRVPVIFEFHIDSMMKQPFANTSGNTTFPDEEEILFSPDTIWRIVSAERENIRWRIILQSCNELDSTLDAVYKEYTSDGPTLMSLGDILQDTGDNDGAKRFYHRMLKQKCLTDGQRGIAHCKLTTIYRAQEDYPPALEHSEKVLELLSSMSQESVDLIKFRPHDVHSDQSQLVAIHRDRGFIYEKLDQVLDAERCYRQALDVARSTSERAAVLNDLGCLLFRNGIYDESYKCHDEAVTLVNENHLLFDKYKMNLTLAKKMCDHLAKQKKIPVKDFNSSLFIFLIFIFFCFFCFYVRVVFSVTN